jgi:hypothetical protein
MAATACERSGTVIALIPFSKDDNTPVRTLVVCSDFLVGCWPRVVSGVHVCMHVCEHVGMCVFVCVRLRVNGLDGHGKRLQSPHSCADSIHTLHYKEGCCGGMCLRIFCRHRHQQLLSVTSHLHLSPRPAPQPPNRGIVSIAAPHCTRRWPPSRPQGVFSPSPPTPLRTPRVSRTTVETVVTSPTNTAVGAQVARIPCPEFGGSRGGLWSGRLDTPPETPLPKPRQSKWRCWFSCSCRWRAPGRRWRAAVLCTR